VTGTESESFGGDHITEESTPDQVQPQAIVQAIGAEILEQVDQRPYTTVAVAAVAGYVLGVAMPNWTTRLAWAVGSRFVVNKIVSSITVD